MGHIRQLFCFLSTMMSRPQSSNLDKRPILKVQIDQDFQFFFLSALTYGMIFFLAIFKARIQEMRIRTRRM